MSADSKLELVIQVDVSQGNAEIKQFNAGLDAMQRQAVNSTRKAATGFEGMSGQLKSVRSELKTLFVGGIIVAYADRFGQALAKMVVSLLNWQDTLQQVKKTLHDVFNPLGGRHVGYYSEREFLFTPYRAMRERMVELGRACVHREHRAGGTLELLGKGIARYARTRGCRFLIGCSSLTSQEPAHGAWVYEILREYEAEPALRTIPQPEFALPPASTAAASGRIPKLLRTYLAVGARICGPPALEREFGTIDFLTWMDLEALPRESEHGY